jgi:hypothetical protein
MYDTWGKDKKKKENMKSINDGKHIYIQRRSE